MNYQDFTNDHDLLIHIATQIDSLDHRLLGNGQPGEIQKLQVRTSALEETKWKMLGGMGVLGFLSGGLGAWVFKLVMR